MSAEGEEIALEISPSASWAIFGNRLGCGEGEVLIEFKLFLNAETVGVPAF